MKNFLIKCKQLMNLLDRCVESFIFKSNNGFNSPSFCAAVVSTSMQQQQHSQPLPSSLMELMKESIVLYCPVPKKRTSHERKLSKKFLPAPNNRIIKWAKPKTNIMTCLDCGSYHEIGTICGKCYQILKRSIEATRSTEQDKTTTSETAVKQSSST